MQIVVTMLSRFDFTNSEGKAVSGQSMEYLGNMITSETKVGHPVVKQSISPALAQKITKIPGVYEVSNFEIQATNDKKSSFMITDLKLVKELKLNEVF